MILLHEKLDNTRNVTITILIRRAEYTLQETKSLTNESQQQCPYWSILRIIINFWHRWEGKSNEVEQGNASKSFTVSNQWQALLVLVFRGNHLKLLSIYQNQGVFTQHAVKQLKLNWKYLKHAEHTARR